MKSEIKNTIDFLIYSEKLKTEKRHAHKSDGCYESAAEHSWRLALLLMLVAPKLKEELDLLKALKMATIHDIVEIDAEDVMVLDHIDNKSRKKFKDNQEKNAIEKVRDKLGTEGQEIYDLWYEYLSATTYEAKVLRVLNMIEGQSQFLSEKTKKFTEAEQEPVNKLIEKTKVLSKIDPFIEELYLSCGDMFRERTGPGRDAEN